MADRVGFGTREDEFEVDFSDTRSFAFTRWNDTVLALQQSLSSIDVENINAPQDWHEIPTKIRKKAIDPQASPSNRRLLNQLLPFPRSLATLVGIFSGAINPHEADFSILWGLLDLNIKLSCVSTEKLSRTISWMKKLRSVTELFNRCLDVCEDLNEARYSMVDFLESFLLILRDSVRHLRTCPTEAVAAKAWTNLDASINENIAEMETMVKHLNDITSYSVANLARQAKNISLRHGQIALPQDHATFPISMIPRSQNSNFYGRTEELERINHYLDHRNNTELLRTYTIYGRRGVGKTDIALQYAYTNPARFEAIFWIQCETSISLRQSFTDMAVELNLPGADKFGHHEENQLAVQKWLKITKKKWLLIFDNAERESILRGYWPVGASGSILITSRRYYNFMNDAKRKGGTLKPFNEKQSWDLLIKKLGPNWQDMDRSGLIKESEVMAAKEFLTCLDGLALCIQQAAELIKNKSIGGPTIASTYQLFREHKTTLPARQVERTDMSHSLDALWDMTFKSLSRNARELLSVLSLLAPENILVDVFLPRNQKALDGRLAFAKQHPWDLEPDSQSTLSDVITVPPALQDAIDELVEFTLITREGRELWAHRVVQEAMIYHSTDELQEYFDSATALVYEAFPKQIHGDYLSGQWGDCQSYISHGAHISVKFDKICNTRTRLKASPQFVDLLYNCAWYLHRVGDYDASLRLVNSAWLACDDKDSIQYGNLCNVAGAIYYELNNLGECRKNWEVFRRIQQNLISMNDLDRSSSYHNMGNLESACGNFEKGMEFFQRAISIRKASGDEAASLLANSYLSLARLHFLRREYDLAFNMVAKSEALISRTVGADEHSMADVHYAYGNIEYAQKDWLAAKRSYQRSLKIGLKNNRIHPITCAAYYSLGCVEFERKHYDNARNYLGKALAIAQLRSPSTDDGTTARILWKISLVLESDIFGTFHKEADDMRIRAEMARRAIVSNGQGYVVVSINEECSADAAEEEDYYDALVPYVFRMKSC